MKKTIALILALALLLSLPFAGILADEEVSIFDVDPGLKPTEAPEPTPVPDGSGVSGESTAAPVLLDRSGAFQLIITAGGDMTIGGDVRKRGTPCLSAS